MRTACWMMMMMMMMIAGATLAAAACSPYDPDLGEAPFRCREAEPHCPDGYVCVASEAPTGTCVRSGDITPAGGADAGASADAAALTCNDDSPIEPNNLLNEATGTPIPDLQRDYTLRRLAICPSSDIDLFRFRIDVDQRNIRVSVIDTQRSRGALVLRVLNQTNIPVAAGNYTSESTLVAELANATRGTYYAEVKSAGMGVNNYGIVIETFD
jgi:hypothetical protein